MQKNIDFLLEHSGTLQSERLQNGPSSDRMKVSGRSFEDLLRRTAEFARGVVFFNDDNKPQGDWSEFFQKVYDYDNRKVRTRVIEAMKASSSVDPHLALLFAFFEQILKAQENINTLTQRQMDFYYSEVLGFRKKESSEGKAIVFVQLKKNAPPVSLIKGTSFGAGKDSLGKTIEYVSCDEVRFCNDTLEHIGVFTNDTGLRPIDGEKVEMDHTFCISSPILNQQAETINISISAPDNVLDVLSSLEAEYTSPDGWQPFKKTSNQDKGTWLIPADSPAITSYDAMIHGNSLITSDPVIRFKSGTNDQGTITSINPSLITGVTVKVNKACNFTLCNGNGVIENKVGAKPFGSSCKSGSQLEIIYPFPLDGEPVVTFSLKEEIACKTDHISYTETKAETETKKYTKSTITLTDSKCDQMELSSNYAKAVIGLMKKTIYPKAGLPNGTPSIASVITDGLIALIPELSEQITFSGSFTDENPTKTLLTPYGSLGLADEQSAYGPISANSGETCVYLAIKEFDLSCLISLYFEIDGDYDTIPSTDISWEVLGQNGWQRLGMGRILKDTTGGMSENGCVILSLDGLNTTQATGLDGDCIWLRGVTHGPNMSRITSVRNHALELEYSPASQGEGPGGRALPKGSITKPLLNIQGVKNVEQPFDGQEGSLKEDDTIYRLRVSEQLRHKKRTWNAWDYEHLILEAFPEVAYVKCLTSCDKDCHNTAGAVTLIIVPSSSEDNLTPQPSTALMNRIRERISKSCSPFVNVHIKGPSYKSIKVSASLVLRKGYSDTSKYEILTCEALTGFFRSWIGHSQSGSHFMPGDNRTIVNGFLENLPYVDYITSLEIYVNDIACKDAISLSKPDEIITSAESHAIVCNIPE